MTETFAALLFAHALADFVLQTGWMVANKRRPLAMLAHILVVLAAAVAATGSLHPAILALAGAHLVIDAVKTHAGRQGLWAYLADQAAHLVTVFATASLDPGIWAAGVWGHLTLLPGLMALAAGLILATRAGGFAVGFLMGPWVAASPQGLPNGGRAIGTLERALIFLLVIGGQAEGIGFLIAAKSVLRFGAVGDDRAVSEYVIIGTLASFGWALAVSLGTITLLHLLAPIGIPDLTP